MDAVVNVTENWGIGLEGRLQVTIREDMRHFRALTVGKTVILGRKTLETFPGGRPLKDRRNIILTTRSGPIEGAETVSSLEELFARLGEEEDVAVIGGASVYRQLLPYCERVYVTKTFASLPADAFFPNLDADSAWTVEESGPKMQENNFEFQFLTYKNRFPRRFSRA